MTTVTITSGHVRRVIGFALHRIISVDVVGERELSETVYDRAWREIQPVYVDGEPGEAEYRLLRIATLGAALRAVAGTRDGQRAELPVAPEGLVDALRDCVHAIDQNHELFRTLAEVDRADVLECRSAALGVLTSLEDQCDPELLRVPARTSQLSMPEFCGPVTVTRGDRVSRQARPMVDHQSSTGRRDPA